MKPVLVGVTALSLSLCGCSSSDSAGDASTSGDGGADGQSAVTECFGLPLPGRALHYSSKAPGALAPYSMTGELRTATPAEAGFAADRFADALAFSTAHSHTQGIIVLRGGYVVGESYAPGFSEGARHESYSMAKSFTSALVGIGIEQKLVSGVDARVCEAYPNDWNCDDASDAHGRITLEHAMNVETGIEWHEDWRSNATGTNDTLLGTAGLLDYVLAKPMSDEPGTVQRYSTGDPALLSGVLQLATGKTAYAFGQDVLFGKIGIPGVQWNSDSKGRTTTYAGLQATTREFAKFGQLYVQKGLWDGEQVVPTDWVAFTTQPRDRCNERYRYLWHVNPPVRLGTTDTSCADFPNCPPTALANLPSDGYFAEGVSGQFIFVFPSADLVVARVAQDDFGSDYWDEWAAGFLAALFDAIEE